LSPFEKGQMGFAKTLKKLFVSFGFKRGYARDLARLIARGYRGVPADHSLIHIVKVISNAWWYGGCKLESRDDQWLLLMSAAGHDISDDKFPEHKERWDEFIGELPFVIDRHDEMSHMPLIDDLQTIIANIGVSKEATRDYTRVYTDDEWQTIFVNMHSENALHIRHLVSGADILEASGANGHWRAVEHHTRKSNDPAKIFAGVTNVHNAKHAKLTQWVHIPAISLAVQKKWDSLVTEYFAWATTLGFNPQPIRIQLRGY
jgi:hypothetical protein